ncbi:MAG TPA: HipA domain-containing protein, partial [Synergistales bacterium]|nr:HipA domain-containing protein [Synergistales bacterium]
MKRICGYCYQALDDEPSFFHETCSLKFFGSRIPPALPYSCSDLDRLAEEAVRSRTTVPGVQEKLSLHLAKSCGETPRLTIVGLWGAYILKPPVEEYPFLPEIEDMTMHLASIAGIETVPHALIPLSDGRLAYITKRVDRLRVKTERTGEMAKRHMEDLCQLAEKPAEYKYIGSMELMSKLIRKYSSIPGYDLTRFFDLALFSFLVGNGDMHLKNVSLIY